MVVGEKCLTLLSRSLLMNVFFFLLNVQFERVENMMFFTFFFVKNTGFEAPKESSSLDMHWVLSC